MCGIAGFIQTQLTQTDAENTLRQMAKRLLHRGPDSQGVYFDNTTGLGFAHARLSIQDLSVCGRQPMQSQSGRYCICYNGEVYNFKQLKQQIQAEQAITWRGHSDTEVILAAIELWGLESALQKFNGMFAFALYDRVNHQLYLARDRLGIKPLYYGWQRGRFIFASELKAFKALKDFDPKLNRQALAQYFKYKYIPAPNSIYENIYKLKPGTILTLPVDRFSKPKMENLKPFWSVDKAISMASSSVLDEATATQELKRLLSDSVALRQLADVPVGAFLSGGIDSSLVVAIAQAQASQKVKTFTIGFAEQKYNEADFAKSIAEHLGTEHAEYYVTSREARDIIPRLSSLYDEPFADSSQIPTFIVSQFARQKVTVCLSGDGGDELFAGYGRYHSAYYLWQKIQSCPALARPLLAAGLNTSSALINNQLTAKLHPKIFTSSLAVKLKKLKNALLSQDLHSLYQNFLQVGVPGEQLVLNTAAQNPMQLNGGAAKQFANQLLFMPLLDLHYYLPGDILTKVDRASMGVSLETRVPLLDHRIVEFAWGLDPSLKYRHGQNKYLLTQLLAQYLPRELFERPKQGFSVPIGQWLNGSLRDWAEDLLNPRNLREQGILNVDLIQKRWRAHKNKVCDWQYWLWNILMFQTWMQNEKLTVHC